MNFEIKISLQHCINTGNNTNRISPDKNVLIDRRELYLMLEIMKLPRLYKYDHK